MLELPGGLTGGGGGFLRASVATSQSPDNWSIAHGLWEISIPRDAVDRPDQLDRLLRRELPVATMDLSSSGSAALVRLLIAQGCLTYDGSRADFGAEEVRYITGAAMMPWYGAYYAHPFWAELEACRLSTTQLFGWMLRTYHLSRSAGVTAARGALHSESGEARATFLRNAIEEFAHCEEHYLPCHPRFGLSPAQIKSLVPLPSSTAFDDRMSIIAEDDWLAHAIVAFFQEHTASFRANAFTLYDKLSGHYGLGGFFDSWKAHVGYDVDRTHAQQFESLLGSRRVGRGELLQSLGAAAATVEHMIATLDELSSIDPSQDLVSFRTPFGQGARLPPTTPDDPWAWAAWLVDTWSSHTSRREPLKDVPGAALDAGSLGPLLLRALAHAEDHDDVLFLGKALSANFPWPELATSHDAETAVSAFLRRRSASTTEFIWLSCLLLKLSRECRTPERPDRLDSMEQAARRWSAAVALSAEDRTRLTALGARFLEICEIGALAKERRLATDIIAVR